MIGKKEVPALQPTNGKSTPGKVDPTDIPPSDPPTEQAPTTDPLYAERKKTLALEDVIGPDADTYMLLEDLKTNPDEIRSVMNSYRIYQAGKELATNILGPTHRNPPVDISREGTDKADPEVVEEAMHLQEQEEKKPKQMNH